MTPEHVALAAMYADTPIVTWPASDKGHLAWWQLAAKLPAKGFRVESDLLPAERRFTTSSENVHGTLFDGGEGQMILLLSADKAANAKVTLALTGAKVQTLEGKDVAVSANVFDAGEFSPWQVKAFRITSAREGGK
jgi:hypothetical protein